MAVTPAIEAPSDVVAAAPRPGWVSVVLGFSRRPPHGAIGAALVHLKLLVAVFPPWIAP
jgi:hypothetical protein